MITQTNPNGSLTDRLVGVLSGVVDTAATAYASKLTGASPSTPAPAPTAAPRVADPAPSLPAQAPATGAGSFTITPQMMLAAGGVLAGVIVLVVVLKKGK